MNPSFEPEEHSLRSWKLKTNQKHCILPPCDLCIIGRPGWQGIVPEAGGENMLRELGGMECNQGALIYCVDFCTESKHFNNLPNHANWRVILFTMIVVFQKWRMWKIVLVRLSIIFKLETFFIFFLKAS